MKMMLQKHENLGHIQRQFSVSFCEKKLILNLADMALSMSNLYDFGKEKCPENLLKDSSLSQCYIAKFHSRQSR